MEHPIEIFCRNVQILMQNETLFNQTINLLISINNTDFKVLFPTFTDEDIRYYIYQVLIVTYIFI